MDDLVREQDVSRGDTCTGGANIKGFGEFDELSPRKIGGPKENGNLEADSRRAARWRIFQALAFLQKLSLHILSHSTRELVRASALSMPEVPQVGLAK